MNPSERILTSAYAVTHGDVGVPQASGLCLALVRIVVEHAFGMRPHEWYEKHVTDWVQPPGYDRSLGHWARDAERSLRNLGMAVRVDERLPGDLIFNWRTAYSQEWKSYIGHVGILLHGDLILENVSPANRPNVFRKGNTAVSPISSWGNVTTAIRFFPRGNE